MSISDPDSNTHRGLDLNYGIGWGKDPKPPAYLIGLVLERVLNKRSALASQVARAHSMLVRNVRLAETAPEKAKAGLLLEEANERVFADNLTRQRKIVRAVLRRLRKRR